MTLVDITRKPVALQGFQLTSESAMVSALAYLAPKGYSGGVNCFKNDNNVVWQMSLQSDTNSLGAQIGNIGDWIVVENDTLATIVPAAKAAELYQLV